MASIQKSIDVDVPVRTAYNQWTQFELFPSFMEGVRNVKQTDDSHLHWETEIAGQRREWDARITEQVPDQRIAWTSENGTGNAGVVTFHRINDKKTRVMLQIEYQPDDIVESIGDTFGLVSRRVEGDLERFKDFIERSGGETGAWRGTVKRRGVLGTIRRLVTMTLLAGAVIGAAGAWFARKRPTVA